MATKKQIENVFALFCKTFRLRPAKRYDDEGGYLLHRGDAGYTIAKVVTRSGALDMPFGYEAHSGPQVVQLMLFAIRVKDGTSR